MANRESLSRKHPMCQAVLGLVTDLEACLHDITPIPPGEQVTFQRLIEEHKGKDTFSDYWGVHSARFIRNRIAHRKPHEPPLTLPEVERARRTFEHALRDILPKCSQSVRDEIGQDLFSENESASQPTATPPPVAQAAPTPQQEVNDTAGQTPRPPKSDAHRSQPPLPGAEPFATSDTSRSERPHSSSTDQPPATSATPPAQYPPPHSGRNAKIWIGLALLALTLIFGANYFRRLPSVGSTTTEQPGSTPSARNPTQASSRVAQTQPVVDARSAPAKESEVVTSVTPTSHEPDRTIVSAAAPTDSISSLNVAVKVNPKDGLKYVWIPPGTFTMGCSPGEGVCFASEQPAHEVTLSEGYWLGQTEVTQEAYMRIAGKNPSAQVGPMLPVQKVNWEEAQVYCRAIGGRLPTEAEWEYAARGGSTAPVYGDLDSVAWYESNNGGRLHEVGLKRPNGFGLYDVLGNVWEWTADWYGETYYELREGRDPKGPSVGEFRTMRGFSWKTPHVSFRARNRPSGNQNDVGFRCVGE